MLQWYVLCACRILRILVALNLYQHFATAKCCHCSTYVQFLVAPALRWPGPSRAPSSSCQHQGEGPYWPSSSRWCKCRRGSCGQPHQWALLSCSFRENCVRLIIADLARRLSCMAMARDGVHTDVPHHRSAMHAWWAAPAPTLCHLRSLSCSWRRGESCSAGPFAGDLTSGEIRPVNGDPALAPTDAWGRLTHGTQLPAPAGTLHRVHPEFSVASFSKGFKKMNF
jgi:hypothetical protein